MALERYFDSSRQSAVPHALPPRVVADGAAAQSSSASGVYFGGDGQSQTTTTSQLNPSFGNLPNSVSGNGWSSHGSASGDISRVLNSAANSGPSACASSLVTDANSALSGGRYLQRSTSINTESYASPISFSSNNTGMSGSSVMDGPSTVQRNSQQDQNPHQIQERQQRQQLGASSATSQMPSQAGQFSPPVGLASNGLLPMQKQQRLDVGQDDTLQKQIMQELLQRSNSIQLQGHNPHQQALIHQQRLLQQRHLQQQQMLQSMPHLQHAHMQQQQLRQQLQQQGSLSVSGVKRPYDGGICARRLMQYLYHQRQRPDDNNILYWRKFVAEYFAPNAKKRWCFSLHETDDRSSLGGFPQAAMLNTWNCDICGSRPARGFESTADALPRLNKIEFDSGVIDELLFVDMPDECRSPSGLMMLEYRKATLESAYKQLRVIRHGQLRIIFTPDLKILSWLFCSRRHEELLPRRLIAPPVNQLVEFAQKCQSAVNDAGSAGVSPQDLQTNCNMFVTAGCQLKKNLDLQLIHDWGFSKRYVRCLQISEVVNSMKDLIDFSRERKIGPIESLRNYPRQAVATKLQIKTMQEMEQLSNTQGGLSVDQNVINKIVATRPGLSSNLKMGGVAMDTSAQTGIALSNYQNLLRQNSMNMGVNAFQTDTSCSLNSPNRTQALSFQSSIPPVPGSLENSAVNGLTGGHHQLHLLQQGQQQSSQANQQLQQHMIQQLMQEIMGSNEGQQRLNGQISKREMAEDVVDASNGRGSLPVRSPAPMVEFGNKTASTRDNAAGVTPSTTNNFNTVTNNSSANADGNGYNARMDLLEDPHLAELLQDFPRDFAESSTFDSEPSNMHNGWKP